MSTDQVSYSEIPRVVEAKGPVEENVGWDSSVPGLFWRQLSDEREPFPPETPRARRVTGKKNKRQIVRSGDAT